MACFKIVATKEKRGVYFTAVPHQWENNKTLFWPEHLGQSQRELLRQDASSVPASAGAAASIIVHFLFTASVYYRYYTRTANN